MVYIIHPDADVWSFVLKGIDNGSSVMTRPLNAHCAKWQLAVRKILCNVRLHSWLLFDRQMQRELNTLKAGDSVVVCDHSELCIFRTLNSLLDPDVKKFFWIWNPIKKNERDFYKYQFMKMVRAGFTPCTFDPQDGNRFGLPVYNQFFRIQQGGTSEANDKYDFYFIGFAKNRESQVFDLQKRLSAYKTYFKIVYSVEESISYEDNIKNIRSSRCLVEIVQEGQCGMTLRPLEALAFRKKLISNNKDLINAEFYKPQNIFIIGVDSFAKIDNFLNTPYVDINKDIITKYDVLTWVNNFN